MSETMADTVGKTLPANAYTKLPPGTQYQPVVPTPAKIAELTPRSIGWGLFLCVIFTIASAYSGLKVGQVMEAAIPISILAIGLARMYRRRSTLLENVIVTGIGGLAGSVVAGAIFTLPALYILKLDPHPTQTIFICLAGGCLGVLFLIPLRRYFVRDMHGELPYPEATAITEVLVTGERGGSQAKLLIEATVISGIYDFLVTTFHVWKELVDFQFIPAVKALSERARVAVSFDAISFILGLGYVMGLRSSLILCAGGVLSNLVLVPLIWMIGSHLGDTAVYPGTTAISHMTANQIFRGYVRFVGVGAIATAGIFGILKSMKVVAGSFGVALRAFRRGEGGQDDRTDRDIPVITILLGVIVSAIGDRDAPGKPRPLPGSDCGGRGAGAGVFVLLYLRGGQRHRHHRAQSGIRDDHADHHHFLRSAAALRRIRHHRDVFRDGAGRDGVHGAFGIGTDHYGFENRLLAGLDAGRAGEGEVPGSGCGVDGGRADHRDAGAGVSVRRCRAGRFARRAAIAAGVYHEGAGGRVHEPAADGLHISSARARAIAVVMEMLGVPALIFALGMYLPLELNTPALVGGFLAYFVDRKGDRIARERAVIVASGLMAGGALGGVLGASFRLFPKFTEDWIKTPFYDNDAVSQVISAVFFVGLCAYLWWRSVRYRKEEAES